MHSHPHNGTPSTSTFSLLLILLKMHINTNDEESDGDAMSNEMEYYLQRCSICFDSRLDFCLEMCRDQFCRDCFQKYVKEVVSNSWGLDVTKIKCPVCQDPLPLTEWSKYVDQATLAQYQQYNQPYRSFSRFCNDCDNEVVISQVKQSIVGLPSRDLLPLFEGLLEQLKLLLHLGGLNFDTASSTSSASPLMFSSMDGRKRYKHGGGLTKRDARAQDVVQHFIKEYRSFCGTNQSSPATLPSMAQSYFSSLAMRALGGGGAPPTPSPLALGQHPNALPSQLGGHGAPPGAQSSGFQQQFDARPTLPQQDSSFRTPSSLFQRRQQPVKTTGVLEMYKDLMVALIELFDLKLPEQRNGTEVVARANAMEATGEHGHLDVSMHTTAGDEVATAANPCEGITIGTVRIQKRALADRSKIITRAESKRQMEVKKALVRFSKELLSMEIRPEQWKELQFLHVRWCRWDWCNKCDQELCLQCGVSSHHESETCFDHMRSVVLTNTPTSQRARINKSDNFSPFNSALMGQLGSKGKERSDLDTGTMQWKLANTNPCPNCCILIHRDDGCNKVDCMLCGHRFCWVCREAWDVGCGFFRCRLALEEPAIEKDSGVQWEKLPGEWEENEAETDEDQVETLGISVGETPHAGHGQADAGAMRQDRRRRRSEDMSAAISEKPEIGVPNVFMIQAKRSRA
ncbi:E3 ubiquitin-protein ligase arih2 [Linnemannia exigua]|uniref:E3 ubiquitin-protein ligase arih2 n=1 Tax=Linnemannia exigua TaxID=604196 RepID=A0AAD4D899_9FUNG|nr:E3 ubiquitin-protein ligase arih2 [Linnemannia exigua]